MTLRRRFGQHFLTDPSILGRIADALEITSDDTVVEIGPGRGTLTEHLAARAKRVVGVEIDRDLAAWLRTQYTDPARVTIVDGDALDADFGALAGGDYLLAGNIPYNITTPLVFKALERPRARRMVFLMQREVAERIVAAPGSEAYGALSANVQALANAELLFGVAAGAFKPPPRVASAVLRMMPRADPVVAPDEEVGFRTLVQGLFAFRRKKLVRALREHWDLGAEAAAGIAQGAGVDPDARPEVLSPEEFARILRARAPGSAFPSGS